MKFIKSKWLMLPAALAVSSSLLAADAYDVVDLGKLNGTQSYAMSINESGQVIGTANGTATNADGNDVSFLGHAVLFDGGTVTDLGALDNDSVGESTGYAINDLGEGIGYSVGLEVRLDENGDPVLDEETLDPILDLYESAVRYDGAGGVAKIPPLTDGVNATMRGLSLNNNGFYVGWGNYNPPGDTASDGSSIETNFSRGFLYDSNTNNLYRIDPLTSDVEDGLNSSLRDINENNRAVGWSTKRVDGVQSTVGIWLDATDPTDLHELNAFGGGATLPYAINDNNQVVGLATNADNSESSAFIYDLDTGEATDIGFFDPALNQPSTAYDINNAGIVVGQAYADRIRRVYHAFIFENGQLSDLNDRIDCQSGWELVTARGINESGEIVGTGTFDGEARAFKLVPRSNGQREACPVEKSDDGGGTLGFYAFLLLPFAIRRRR